MAMKRRRYDDDSEISYKKPRSDHFLVRVDAAVPGFIHRKEKNLGLDKNRQTKSGTEKIGNSVRIAVPEERNRQVIGSSQPTGSPLQISTDTTNSRAELMKVRFHNLIQKTQNQQLYSGSVSKDESFTDPESMRIQELAKQRKAAREKIESMTRTVELSNNLGVIFDMAKIMGDSNWLYGYGG